MRKRTPDKDKKDDKNKNKKESGAEQNPRSSYADGGQEPAAVPSPSDGDRTPARRPRRRRSASEKVAPIPLEAGPTPTATPKKAPPGEQDAASHAAAPGEGGGKHGNPASEKRKPRNGTRKNTGNEKVPSKKGTGASYSVPEPVKNNTDNENNTLKSVVAAETTDKKHPGNKKVSVVSSLKNNDGHKNIIGRKNDVAGEKRAGESDKKNKTGNKNTPVKTKKNAEKKDKNVIGDKNNAASKEKALTQDDRKASEVSGGWRAPKGDEQVGSVSSPDIKSVTDNVKPTSPKRPRRRGRSLSGRNNGIENASDVDKKIEENGSDIDIGIDTGINTHGEIVKTEPAPKGEEAESDASKGDRLPAAQKAQKDQKTERGKRRKNPYSPLEYGSVQMMSSLRGFAPLGMLFVLMDVLKGREEGLIHINQLAQSLSIGKPSLLAQLENLEAAGLLRTLSSSRMGRHVELLSPNLVRSAGSGDDGAESSPFAGLLPVPPSAPGVPGEEAGGQFSAAKLEGLARYLQRHGVEIVHIPDESNLDPRISQIAGFLGKYLSYVLPFYETLKATLNEGAEFTYSLAGLNGRDITHTLNLCRMLREVDFLSSYAYRRAPHYKIVARVNRTPTAINFLTGGWLEHFIRDKVVSILTTHPATLDLPYAFMKNPCIILPGGEDFELDLLLSVGERIFWIEAKTGEYMEFLPKYSRVSKVLGLDRNTSMLVSVGALAPADNLSARYELSCCNLDEFADVFRINLVRELQQGSIRRRRG